MLFVHNSLPLWHGIPTSTALVQYPRLHRAILTRLAHLVFSSSSRLLAQTPTKDGWKIKTNMITTTRGAATISNIMK